MRRVLQRIFFGVVLLAVAVLIFANGVFGLNLHVEDFRGWWTLFIIIPGISGIIADGPKFWNILLSIIGISLLVHEQAWLKSSMSDSIFWSGIIIIFALWLIIGAFRPRGNHIKNHINKHISGRFSNQDSNDYPEYAAVFSSYETKNTSKTFRGGKASAVFGGLVIDLSDIELFSDANLEVNAVFGGVELILPKDLPVKITATPVFGGVENSATNTSKAEGKYTLYIKASAVFGGIQIGN